MNAVLAGLLGTYTSRNSDLGGYWLLGQVPLDSWPTVIDLLGEPPPGVAPVDAARRLAVGKFRDQLQKARIHGDRVAEATLQVSLGPTVVWGWQGEYGSDGRELRFAARATLIDGRTYACERTVFAAPHDPTKERQRVPEYWGT